MGIIGTDEYAGRRKAAADALWLPVLSPLPMSGRYVVRSRWEFDANGYPFAVPVGYTYDGASIPKGAWYTTYSPFNPHVMVAALEHDWLCDQRPREVNHLRAAEHFGDRLEQAGVPAWKRILMVQAVRWLGPKW